MQTRTVSHDLPVPIWIALVILGFVLFWPLGLFILFYLIWSGKVRCCNEKLTAWKSDNLQRRCTPFGKSVSTGNMAFDEYRETTLRRLEAERREFNQFLERLRRAKDQEEFDRFMSEQAAGRQQS
jgi:hypothetical protein